MFISLKSFIWSVFILTFVACKKINTTKTVDNTSTIPNNGATQEQERVIEDNQALIQGVWAVVSMRCVSGCREKSHNPGGHQATFDFREGRIKITGAGNNNVHREGTYAILENIIVIEIDGEKGSMKIVTLTESELVMEFSDDPLHPDGGEDKKPVSRVTFRRGA